MNELLKCVVLEVFLTEREGDSYVCVGNKVGRASQQWNNHNNNVVREIVFASTCKDRFIVYGCTCFKCNFISVKLFDLFHDTCET